MESQCCAAHGRKPSDDDKECYGELFICVGCESQVCAGYGADDLLFDFCDECFADASGLDRPKPPA